MVRQILPISALLLGSALLLFAGGMNGLILPVRGAAEGFSALSLGLLGTGWALGYVLGCWYTPRLVGKVGHIRSFSAMAALAAVAILASALLVSPGAWIPLRGLSGFCFAGAAMIVESWLSERADARSRGKIFGVYTMVNLAASTAGQMALTLGDTTGFAFFALGAIFYCLALIPTAISSTTSPKPLVTVSLDLRALWRNSPVAVFGVFMVGISNSAFGTLAAVYATNVGLVLTTIALFTSLPILAGAASQIPIGILSDRMDRRKVLVGIAAVAALTDLAFVLLASTDPMVNLVLASLFGAMIYAMYPVIIAHANDHAAEGTFIQTSGGLLMIFGFGAILGPLLAGLSMATVGDRGLFLTSVAAHVLLILFALLRMRIRQAVPEADKSDFVFVPPAKASTPETVALAVRDGVEDDAEDLAARMPETADTPPEPPAEPPAPEAPDTPDPEPKP